MYKSSPFTFVFKYLFFPLWGGGFATGIILSWNRADQFSQHWARTTLPLVCFASIWLIFMMIRLRNVEATEEYLIIKSFKGKKIVDYRDIEWITQFAMVNPGMISMKYNDIDTGKTKKILILLPREFRGFSFIPESDMTIFIRERIIASKPDYSKDSEPSRWIALILIFATAIPVTLLASFYFRYLP